MFVEINLRNGKAMLRNDRFVGVVSQFTKTKRNEFDFPRCYTLLLSHLSPRANVPSRGHGELSQSQRFEQCGEPPICSSNAPTSRVVEDREPQTVCLRLCRTTRKANRNSYVRRTSTSNDVHTTFLNACVTAYVTRLIFERRREGEKVARASQAVEIAVTRRRVLVD